MAHFALIDDNNMVQEVIVVSDTDAPTEEAGQAFIASIGLTGTWMQTSYNTHGAVHALDGTPFRCNYAAVGHTYDADRDAFIPPQPYPSWILDETTCLWEPPVAMPDDGNTHIWNETTTSWEQV